MADRAQRPAIQRKIRGKTVLFLRILAALRRRRMLTQQALFFYRQQKWKSMRELFLVICILVNSQNATGEVLRSCCQLPRNSGWWQKVWSTYPDSSFKKLFHVSKGTGSFLIVSVIIWCAILFAKGQFLLNVA